MSDTNITKALYDGMAIQEDERLNFHPLELAMTLDTIERHLHLHRGPSGTSSLADSPVPLKIADIGGATGTYAFALADRGCLVHLRDLSPGLLAIASRKQTERLSQQRTDTADGEKNDDGILASIGEGNVLDARSLFPESYEGLFDAALLLGPLYHLLAEDERARAIQNALALLKPTTGILFAAFVSRNAHLRDIAMRDPSRLVREHDFYARYLKTGIYVRRGERNAESYHASLAEIAPLVEKAGGSVLEIVGTEGILGGGLDKQLVGVDREVLSSWLDVMREAGRQELNLGNADHWLVVIKENLESCIDSNIAKDCCLIYELRG